LSNALFVRSYPAPGADVVPATFGAGLRGYFLLGLLPVSAVIWFGIALRNDYSKPKWLFYGLAISLAGIFVALAFLHKLELEIRMDGVSYTRLLRGTSFVAYADVSSVVLIDYRHARSQATPSRSIRRWTAIITPKVGVGAPARRIPLTLFPDSACREFVRLFKPEVWESGT
jgi:hypothetical protein